MHQPRLLFLDEPTVGVDPQSRNQIFESVQRLNRERGMTEFRVRHGIERHPDYLESPMRPAIERGVTTRYRLEQDEGTAALL